jgi:hypothetical protein
MQEFQFIRLFDGPNSKTLKQFIISARVKSGEDRITRLEEYMENHYISKSDIKLLYDHIINRSDYLHRFYKKSLEPVEPLSIKEPPMPLANINNDRSSQYKNRIRNMHCFDILKKTKSGFSNHPAFFDVLFDLYKKELIDYKILTPSALQYLREGRIGSVFSSFYFRASIMNPLVPFSLEKRLLKGSKIFSPTLGWSSYAYGFLECEEVEEYVATDVIPEVCEKTADFCKEFYPSKKTQIFCEPSENLAKNRSFMTKYREHFDVVFFSPPYYELEKYPGKNQSINHYDTYEEWLEKYWKATIEMCYHILQPGGRLCYILSSYGCSGSVNCKKYDLIKDMNLISKQWFQYKRSIPMYNKNVHVTVHRETNEKILLFMKGL